MGPMAATKGMKPMSDQNPGITRIQRAAAAAWIKGKEL
jgi:hypothetical protein